MEVACSSPTVVGMVMTTEPIADSCLPPTRETLRAELVQVVLDKVAYAYPLHRNENTISDAVVDIARVLLGLPVIDRTPKFVPRGGE